MKTRIVKLQAFQSWSYLLLVLGFVLPFQFALGGQVSLLTDRILDPPAQYGLARLELSLTSRDLTVERVPTREGAKGDILIVAGVASRDGVAPGLLKEEEIPLPSGPEALVIRKRQWNGKPMLILCGSDARGLLYAALDVADRIGWSDREDDPLYHVRDAAERPDVLERSLSIYTMHRAHFESRLYNESYWERYFDLMARSRLNSFVIIFGYENGGFMAPPYPYFFDTESFPGVRLVGITPEEQERNTRAFKRVITLAHERGVDFIAGIWDHIYRGGVQAGGISGADRASDEPTPGLVWGLTRDNLAPYNKTALKKFLETFPEIDGIQFRMHGESGLKRSEIPRFWHEIFQMIRQMRPELRVDTRAKGLPDAVIEDALAQGINFRVATKYWMEQMGLPFHPTHINPPNQHDRRHGYADLLRYPQRYRVHLRMWTGGTTRLLLWGDPEYVRRFAESVQIYNGNSFEVNEPLATKMLAQPHDLEPRELVHKAYRHYQWEFERYWHFYQVFGRIGYNPATPSEVWEREFEKRFGKQAGPALMSGLHRASGVLPRIVASSYRYRYFPTTRGWAEKMRMDDLPVYATAEGSDVEQFASFEEEAKLVLEGKETARRRPPENSRWFAQISQDILERVEEAQMRAGGDRSREFISTVTDLKILAYLALYHARRIPAAVSYKLFDRTRDLFALEDAMGHEKKAIQAWEQIVRSAGDVYADELSMGIPHGGLSGHWKDELALLKKGLGALQETRGSFTPKPGGREILIAHVPVRRIFPREDLTIRATVTGAAPLVSVRCGWRSSAGPYRFVDLKPLREMMYAVKVPHAGETGSLSYFIEAEDTTGLKTTYPEQGGSQPVNVTVSSDRNPPTATVKRIAVARPGEPLRVEARVQDPSGVKWVRLRYRHVTQFEDYETLEMEYNRETETYEAEIPGEFIISKWNLMYLVEVMDTRGNGRMVPDLEKEMPYVMVQLDR